MNDSAQFQERLLQADGLSTRHTEAALHRLRPALFRPPRVRLLVKLAPVLFWGVVLAFLAMNAMRPSGSNLIATDVTTGVDDMQHGFFHGQSSALEAMLYTLLVLAILSSALLLYRVFAARRQIEDLDREIKKAQEHLDLLRKE
jgi:hypothetical protein